MKKKIYTIILCSLLHLGNLHSTLLQVKTEVLLVGYSVSCRGLPGIMYDLLRLSMIFFL